jgi:hypothetical protein
MNSILGTAFAFARQINAQKLLTTRNIIKTSQYFSSTKSTDEAAEWKTNVVVQSVETTKEDLLRKHKALKDGFYINHRLYIEKTPEKYTIEPFKTRRTGGKDIETGN